MRNIIITNISALPTKEPQESVFISDIGEFSGKYTNEAPIKYLMSYLKNKDEKTDIIIAVRTTEAIPAYELFEKVVKKYAEETEIPEPEIIPIETSEDELEKTIDDIIRLVNNKDSILIDTTGGFRNSSYLLMALVRFLEYAGIGLTKAIYARYHDEKKIVDITDTYKMFDLINAVNTFSIMGNSRELERYFASIENEAVKQTIAAMNNFSDEISLCRTSKLDTVLKSLNDSLNILSTLESDSKDVIMLKSLSEKIRNKFGCNNKIEYPDVVKWCLDNKMIQQAVTIYVEKIPEYFYKKGYFSVSDKRFADAQTKNESSHNDFYYELFYSNFLVDLISGSDKVSSFFAEIAQFIKDNSVQKNLSSFNSSKSPIQLVLDALIECNDYDTFRSRTTNKSFNKFEFDTISNELKRFFKVRNAFYSNNKLRTESDIEKRLDKIPEVAQIVDNNKFSYPNSISGFIETINNNKPLCKAIFHPDSVTGYENSHLTCLDAITDDIKGADFRLTDKLSKWQLQSIFRDIYYAKTFIRNKLNHASDDESSADELKDYFRINGYQVDTELSVSTISEFLYNAINKLEL